MKNLWIIIIAAVLIRIFLSLTTYHSDMQVFQRAGQIVASGNILSLYDFTSDSAVFNYPPVIYLYHGFFKFIIPLSQPFSLKLPYLIFDLLAALLLYKLSGKKLLAVGLWLFNPVNLYATYMMGQFDIIPAFFIVLSLFLIIKNKLSWAAAALGFGIAFKLFPIFLIIPLIIFGKNIWSKLRLLFLSFAPYLLSVVFYLPSESFRNTALFANQSSKSLYAVIPVSGGEAIFLFPLFLILFYLFILGKNENISRLDITKIFLIPLLLFFIFTHYHPQWLIWITPLLILDLVNSRFRNLFPNILIFLSWFATLFFFDPSLTVGIFSTIPVASEMLSIWQMLGINVDFNLSRSLLQTVFAAASLFLIYQFFPRKDHV